MSKKANPTLIGLFIVVGLALGVSGLLLFSSARLFAHTKDYILYFNESLNGLNEGAPVKLRGVTIGQVKRVMVHYNQADDDTAMPVIAEVREDLLAARLGPKAAFVLKRALSGEVSTNLRASLKAESMLTGVLYIDVEREPNPPPAVYHQLEKIYPEVPTSPTGIQQLMDNLSHLDFKGLQEKLSTLVTHLDSAIGKLQTGNINRELTNLLSSATELIRSPDLTNTLATARSALVQYRSLAETLDRRVDPLADSVTNTLGQASRTLAELRAAADNLRATLAPDSPLQHDLDLALDQLANAGQGISSLTEFLNQHPNALITGRKTKEKTP